MALKEQARIPCLVKGCSWYARVMVDKPENRRTAMRKRTRHVIDKHQGKLFDIKTDIYS